jgi:hypothetical protein
VAKEGKRVQKTEVLSMRMDPKTRFVLEILARLRGQSISTVVERAIVEAAENTDIGGAQESGSKNWKDFWHVNEGIRWLKMAADQNLFPTFDDEYKLSFTKLHWPFFYTSAKCSSYNEWAIEILWPRIDEFVDVWTRTKSADYFAAGELMRKAISEAGVVAPAWPPNKKGEQNTSYVSFQRDEMDDEIPF